MGSRHKTASILCSSYGEEAAVSARKMGSTDRQARVNSAVALSIVPCMATSLVEQNNILCRIVPSKYLHVIYSPVIYRVNLFSICSFKCITLFFKPWHQAMISMKRVPKGSAIKNSAIQDPEGYWPMLESPMCNGALALGPRIFMSILAITR